MLPRKFILPLLLAILMFKDVQAQSPMYRFTVENMWVINSRFSELSLMPYSDDVYILMSDRGGRDKYNKWTGGNAYDLYFIDRSDWTKITRPQTLNTKYSDGPASVYPGGELVITKTNKRGEMNPKSGLMVHELNLSNAVMEGEIWSVNVIPEFSSPDHSYAHPALNSEGNMMILASSQDEGYGGRDLYISYLINDKWSEPVNLGPAVNTKGDETFPFLHPDGSLYFASTGHPGYGGSDIFVTSKKGRKWTQPLNLGEPVNSAANEFAISFNDDMDRGFVSSNRLSGKGGDDIYAIFVDKIYDLPVSRSETEYHSGAAEQVKPAEDKLAVAQVEEPVTTDLVAESVKEPVVEAGIQEVSGSESTEMMSGVQLAEDLTQDLSEDEDLVEALEVTEASAAPQPLEEKAKLAAAEQKKRNRPFRKQNEVSDPQVEIAEIVLSGTLAEEVGEEIDQAALTAKQEEEALPIETEPAEEVVLAYGQEIPEFEVEIEDPLEPVAVVRKKDPAIEKVEEVAEPEIAAVEIEEAAAIPVEPAATEAVELENSMRSAELKNIYFGMNSSRLDSESEAMLIELAELFKAFDGPVIELHAHADATGDHNINIKLSELRARSVMQFLHKQGIPMERMCYLAYGESDLYLSQQAEAELNRRVEFRLRSYDHQFLDKNDPARIEGFAYKQLPMLGERNYYVQLAALSDMRTFSTYKLKEYGTAVCYYQGGLYKYVLGPFETMEAATIELQKVRSDYRDAFIFKNE